MRIYTQEHPIFYAKGRDATKKRKHIFLFSKFEVAQKKGQELIFQGFKKVSIGRVK